MIMKYFIDKKKMVVAFQASFVLLAVACGQAPAPATPPPAAPPAPAPAPAPVVAPQVVNLTGCAEGSTSLFPGALASCFPVAQFDNQCSLWGGRKVTVAGASVCRFTSNSIGSSYYNQAAFNMSTLYMVPVLTPESPNSLNAYDTRINLLEGDRLQIAVSGGWSAKANNTSSTTLLGFIRLSSTSVAANCSSNRWDYTVAGSTASVGTTLGSLPGDGAATTPTVGGLYGSIGSNQVFFVGTGTSQIAAQAGTLKLGFNAPSEAYLSEACSDIRISRLSVERCIDVTGKTYRCE
jgi:hypothetical protein